MSQKKKLYYIENDEKKECEKIVALPMVSGSNASTITDQELEISILQKKFYICRIKRLYICHQIRLVVLIYYISLIMDQIFHQFIALKRKRKHGWKKFKIDL